MAEQLTTLVNVKAWLVENSATNDALIQRLINSASQVVLNYVQRGTMYKRAVSAVKDGLGGNTIVLGNWPVASVSSVNVDGITIQPAANSQSSGYMLEGWNGAPPGFCQLLTLIGGCFTRGTQNVSVSYLSGFFVPAEIATVPATGPYTITSLQAHGPWMRDEGVTLANGTPLVAVTGAPAAGQYSVAAATGIYTFNAAQANASVSISYSYVPADIEQAVIEIVAERYRYMKRIGQTSNSAAGQMTISFSLKAINDYTALILNPYKQAGTY